MIFFKTLASVGCSQEMNVVWWIRCFRLLGLDRAIGFRNDANIASVYCKVSDMVFKKVSLNQGLVIFVAEL